MKINQIEYLTTKVVRALDSAEGEDSCKAAAFARRSCDKIAKSFDPDQDNGILILLHLSHIEKSVNNLLKRLSGEDRKRCYEAFFSHKVVSE